MSVSAYRINEAPSLRRMMERLHWLELLMWMVFLFQILLALGLVGIFIWMLFNV